jgi:tight adherence protein B
LPFTLSEALFFAAVFVAVLLLAGGLPIGAAPRPSGDPPPSLRKGAAAPALAWLETLLAQAGVALPAAKAATAMAAATLAAGLLLVALAQPALALAAAPMLGAGLPLLALGAMRRRRLARFSAQLPAALDTVVLSLRAGHPVNAAMAMVARKMPAPVGSEFAVVCDEMTYGQDLRESLAALGRRVPVGELHFLVVAIRIQMGTGGNLAEVLATLARMMRERGKLQAKIRALSAEGRLSAVVLAVVPFLVVAAVTVFNPNYYGNLTADDSVRNVVIGGFCGLFAGVVTVARMIRFRV